MKIKKIFFILFITLISSNLFSETIKNHTVIKADSLFFKYLNTHINMEFSKHIVATNKKLGIPTKSGYEFSNEKYYIHVPIEMQKDKRHPTKGIWSLSFDIEQSGKIRTYNVRFEARADKPPIVIPKVMGETVASYTLSRDIIPHVKVRAKAKMKNINKDDYYKTFMITDTKIIDTLYPKNSSNFIKGPVKEKWIIKACGQEVSLLIGIMPDPEGGSNFVILE